MGPRNHKLDCVQILSPSPINATKDLDVTEQLVDELLKALGSTLMFCRNHPTLLVTVMGKKFVDTLISRQSGDSILAASVSVLALTILL